MNVQANALFDQANHIGNHFKSLNISHQQKDNESLWTNQQLDLMTRLDVHNIFNVTKSLTEDYTVDHHENQYYCGSSQTKMAAIPLTA